MYRMLKGKGKYPPCRRSRQLSCLSCQKTPTRRAKKIRVHPRDIRVIRVPIPQKHNLLNLSPTPAIYHASFIIHHSFP